MAKQDEPTFEDALEAHEAGDIEAAMIICEGLLGEKEEKADPEVQHLLGECLLEMQEPQEALRFFDLALGQVPGESVLLLGRGVALFELLQLDAAVASLKQASDADIEAGEPLFYLGIIAEFRGDREGADALYTTAVERSPEELILPKDWAVDDIMAAFNAMVEEAPDPVAEWLASLPVSVRDVPVMADVEANEGTFSPLRHCRFVGERGDGPFGEDPKEWLGATPTDVILYRRNIGKTAHDEYELHREVFEAVLWEMMDFLCLEDEHMVQLGVLEVDDDDDDASA